MTDLPEPARGEPPVQRRLATRLYAARWVLVVAAAGLLLLAGLGRLSAVEALLAFAAIAAAAMISAPPASTPAPVVSIARERTPTAIDPQLAAVIGSLPEAALLMDRRGIVLAGNEAAATTLGAVRRGEPVSITVRAPEVVEAVRAAAADGKARRVEFAERVPLDRSLEAHVVPIDFESGKADGSLPDLILLAFRDFTYQRRVDQLRADFVANASHELRTPLASLSGFIETLQGAARDDPAARNRFLSIMVEQAQRMSRLIDDLLSLSRIELNQHLRPETVVDLVPILGHVCDTLAPLAREYNVALELKKDAGALPVRGDRDELIRLFENLVENALKYGASGKRVEISARSEESEGIGEAVVTVRDFGPGIAPEHLPRLTERFYRVDVETSRAQGGTGLGLALVKHILARHRGHLAVESKVGEGALFTVRLDLAGSDVHGTEAISTS